MNAVKLKSLRRSWPLMRVLRLAVGVFAIAKAFAIREWLPAIAGAYLLYTAFANTGCCGVNGCALPRQGGSEAGEEEDAGHD
ncbi:MAG TPA: hypothetical protein VHE54_09175 [Puia sp.]|nr:hypothetical protein [Puia sp.]